jgi:hypothetical protein
VALNPWNSQSRSRLAFVRPNLRMRRILESLNTCGISSKSAGMAKKSEDPRSRKLWRESPMSRLIGMCSPQRVPRNIGMTLLRKSRMNFGTVSSRCFPLCHLFLDFLCSRNIPGLRKRKRRHVKCWLKYRPATRQWAHCIDSTNRGGHL